MCVSGWTVGSGQRARWLQSLGAEVSVSVTLIHTLTGRGPYAGWGRRIWELSSSTLWYCHHPRATSRTNNTSHTLPERHNSGRIYAPPRPYACCSKKVAPYNHWNTNPVTTRLCAPSYSRSYVSLWLHFIISVQITVSLKLNSKLKIVQRFTSWFSRLHT